MGDFAKEVNNRAKEVDSLLQKRKHVEAIKVSLQNPPFQCKDQTIKDKNTATVLKALSSLSEKEIDKVTKMLYSDAHELCDNLMKYVYRGLSEGQYSGILFKWHASCVEVAGQGPIIRSMTDRKGV